MGHPILNISNLLNSTAFVEILIFVIGGIVLLGFIGINNYNGTDHNNHRRLSDTNMSVNSRDGRGYRERERDGREFREREGRECREGRRDARDRECRGEKGDTPTRQGIIEEYESQFDGYTTDSPDQWKIKFPNAGGSNQSPINIKSNAVILMPPGSRKSLSFNRQYFIQPNGMSVLNDGYGIVLGSCFEDEYPTLSGGPLKNSYRFNLAQFKWGPTDDEGSEHTINSKRYAMEMQLMHIKGDRVYDNLDTAVKERALLFISFFFDVTTQDNPYLSPLIDRLKQVQSPNSSYPIDPFPLCWLFQPFKSKYYYYQGSLTSPPCTEGVDWIIQHEPLSISRRQINAFRDSRAIDGPMRMNARPVQKINNRCIQFFL